ncbi:MAG: polyprenyl diphosphate synthase [Vampirovibrionales bacterium]|nr:polyprenyl diphosphate synthase [Vampirovibrionales bacterium]
MTQTPQTTEQAKALALLSPEAQALILAGGLQHAAIIMDGNRRWAKSKGLPTLMGHKQGVQSLKNVVRFASDVGLKALTVYAFSTENWQRSAEEVGGLMALFIEALLAELNELHEKNVRIVFVGQLDGLPKTVQATLAKGMAHTANNTGLTLQVATNYGGRAEILAAATQLARKVQAGELSADAIDESVFAQHLATQNQLPEPDVLIRTGGEQRWSNFLLWQCAYAEFICTPVLWPEFTPACFAATLNELAQRHRRFGK